MSSTHISEWEFKSSRRLIYFAIVNKGNKWIGCYKRNKEEAISYSRQRIQDMYSLSSKQDVIDWLNGIISARDLRKQDIPFSLLIILGMEDNEQLPIAKVITCECGAEKCGTTHAFWCPKFNP